MIFKPPQFGRPNILFFDVNGTLLDLAPLQASLRDAFGGRGDLPTLWFTSLLHYSLVATVSDRYRDFLEIGVAVLQVVAGSHGIGFSEEEARQALAPLHSLPPHPEVKPALERLRQAGFRLATLSNSSQAMLNSQLDHAGITGYFEAALSVETVAFYKPHPHTYHWAAQRMGVEAHDSLLVAAHGWDVAGALWAGMRAVFIQRPGQQLYPLAEAPECNVSSLGDLADYLSALPGCSQRRSPT